jgi:hypothetical protein
VKSSATVEEAPATVEEALTTVEEAPATVGGPTQITLESLPGNIKTILSKHQITGWKDNADLKRQIEEKKSLFSAALFNNEKKDIEDFMQEMNL